MVMLFGQIRGEVVRDDVLSESAKKRRRFSRFLAPPPESSYKFFDLREYGGWEFVDLFLKTLDFIHDALL